MFHEGLVQVTLHSASYVIIHEKKKKTYLQSHGIEARIPGIKKGQKMLLVLHDTIE